MSSDSEYGFDADEALELEQLKEVLGDKYVSLTVITGITT